MDKQEELFNQTIPIAKDFIRFFIKNKYEIPDEEIDYFFENLPISIDKTNHGNTRGYYSPLDGICIIKSHIPNEITLEFLSVYIHEIGHAISDKFSNESKHRIIEEGMVTKFTDECINYCIENGMNIDFLSKDDQDYVREFGFSSNSYPLPTSIAKTFSLFSQNELAEQNSTPDKEYFFGDKRNFIFALDSVFKNNWKNIVSELKTILYDDFPLTIVNLFPYFTEYFNGLSESEQNNLSQEILAALSPQSTTQNSLYHRNFILQGLILEQDFQHNSYFDGKDSITLSDVNALPLQTRQLLYSVCGHGIYTETVLRDINNFYHTSSLDDFLSIFNHIGNLPPSISFDILANKINQRDTQDFELFVEKFHMPSFLSFDEKMDLVSKYLSNIMMPSYKDFSKSFDETKPIANGILNLFYNLEFANLKNKDYTQLRSLISIYQLATLNSNDALDENYMKCLMLKLTLSDSHTYGKDFLEFLKTINIFNDLNSNIPNSISVRNFEFLSSKYFDDGINYTNPIVQKKIASQMDSIMKNDSINFVRNSRIKLSYERIANQLLMGLFSINKLYPNLIKGSENSIEMLNNLDFSNFSINFVSPQNEQEANSNIEDIIFLANISDRLLLPHLAVGLNENLRFNTSIAQKIDAYKAILGNQHSLPLNYLVRNAANFLADNIADSDPSGYKVLKFFANSISLKDKSASHAFDYYTDDALEI